MMLLSLDAEKNRFNRRGSVSDDRLLLGQIRDDLRTRNGPLVGNISDPEFISWGQVSLLTRAQQTAHYRIMPPLDSGHSRAD